MRTTLAMMDQSLESVHDMATFLMKPENEDKKNLLLLKMKLFEHDVLTNILPPLSNLVVQQGDIFQVNQFTMKNATGLRYALANSVFSFVPDPKYLRSATIPFDLPLEGDDLPVYNYNCKFKQYVVSGLLDNLDQSVSNSVKKKIGIWIGNEYKKFLERLKLALNGERRNGTKGGLNKDSFWIGTWDTLVNKLGREIPYRIRSSWTNTEIDKQFDGIVKKIIPIILTEPKGFYVQGVKPLADRIIRTRFFPLISSLVKNQKSDFKIRIGRRKGLSSIFDVAQEISEDEDELLSSDNEVEPAELQKENESEKRALKQFKSKPRQLAPQNKKKARKKRVQRRNVVRTTPSKKRKRTSSKSPNLRKKRKMPAFMKKAPNPQILGR